MFILSVPFYNHYLFHIFYSFVAYLHAFISLASFIYHFVHVPIICAYIMPYSTFFLKHQTLFQNLYIKLVGNIQPYSIYKKST